MLPGYKANVEAFRPLLQLTDAVMLTSKEVGAHLRYSEEALSLMRRKNKGPTWLKLPSGGVRYRMSDVLAWEIAAEAGPLTINRVVLAIMSCADVPIEHRAKLADHIQQALTETK